MFRFRLQVLLDKRIEHKAQALEVLATREKELATERQMLKKLEDEVAQAEERYRIKRMERVGVDSLKSGSLSRRTDRLAGLKLDVQSAQSTVLSQQIFVDQATDAVDEARTVANLRQQEVDVLAKYRANMEAKYLQELARREELEQDEIGSVMHLNRRVQK